MDGVGLDITVFSYRDRLDGVVFDRAMAADACHWSHASLRNRPSCAGGASGAGNLGSAATAVGAAPPHSQAGRVGGFLLSVGCPTSG
jgi:hypothetical protein